MKPSMNMVLLIGEVTRNFPPNSERGPALLKVKTQRNGFGSKAGEVFDDYVGVTCWGRNRELCQSIQVGDVVRVSGTISERKVGEDWKTQVTADEVMRFSGGSGADYGTTSRESRPISEQPGPYASGDDIPF